MTFPHKRDKNDYKRWEPQTGPTRHSTTNQLVATDSASASHDRDSTADLRLVIPLDIPLIRTAPNQIALTRIDAHLTCPDPTEP
jgi:hypothetical protein